MAAIQGLNRHTSSLDIILGKIGAKPRTRSVAMQWGKLFEFVICGYVEYVYDTKMEAQDLFVKGRPGQSYSPDGLAIVELEHTYSAIEAVADEYDRFGVEKTQHVERTYRDYHIVLFEFKCPYSRQIGSDGNIPSCYLPQVKAGLDTIDITDIGIYAEAMFRKCEWTDIGFNNSYHAMSTGDTKRAFNEVLAYGFVLFYSDNRQANGQANAQAYQRDQELEALASVIEKEDYAVLRAASGRVDEIPDIGSLSSGAFQVVMNNFESANIHPLFSSIYTADSIVNNIEQHEDWPKFPFARDATGHNIANIEAELSHYVGLATSKGYDVYGVFPWKLFGVSYTYVQKEIGYLDNLMPEIDSIMDVVSKCKADPENTEKYIEEYKCGGTRGIHYDADLLDELLV